MPVSARADAAATLDPLVVTATRSLERSFDTPASVDRIDAELLQGGQPMVNLSETLVRVPGLNAQNRQNYAQDLQLSSRGFGARAAFGVRGVRLYQDAIPVTMPDGQGQTGSFSLFSAQRIEVLRGPFSTLYGNAAGGVVAVFSETGVEPPTATTTFGGGSYGTWMAGAKLAGAPGGVGLLLAATRFSTAGFRDHSAATRDVVNVKADFAAGNATRVTLVASQQTQPDSQDPLGLTRSQWEADPRQADPAAIAFDTRKTIRHTQTGARIEHRLADDLTLQLTAYGGLRAVRQYLALIGSAPASSGGVTDLDRDFGGLGGRLAWSAQPGGRPLRLILGFDVDRQHERRRGYVNNAGNLGDLRRDEDDVVTNVDGYAQVEWEVLPDFSLTTGVRVSDVAFRTDDHYVAAANPDDSGRRDFSHVSPVVGVVWHAGESLNVYANYGQGFETPTFAELAYRPAGPGLNLGLDAATSRAVEVGVKLLAGDRQRLNVAVFAIDTDDEIVVDAAIGGRTTYRNAGRTRRRGAELAWDARWNAQFTSHVALTWLRAEFAGDFATGAPPVAVAAGAKLPGVPPVGAYAEAVWTPGGLGGLQCAIELQHTGKVYVNDRNSDAAPAYTIAHLRAGFEQSLGAITLREFVRINNVGDRNYVGSVIVGDANGRYFEPAPGRNWYAGLHAQIRF